MAGLFGSITIKGNRLTEFASQTATVGVEIPFGAGKFPCTGNVIFANLPPKEHVKKKKQGKGGVKTETYSYTLDYAIAFCEGPIYGFWTIRRNGKIVYTQDPTATIEDKAYAAKWLQKATLYYGTRDQMPDSTIEAVKGAGKVSAFRDLAYIVVEGDDVTDEGGAVPTYEAIAIAHSDGYSTSPPYSIQFQDALDSQSTNPAFYYITWPTEGLNATSDAVSGDLRTILKTYAMVPEAIDAVSTVVSGDLRTILKTYTAAPEAIDSSSDVVSGVLKDILIPYTMAPEGINSSSDIVSGDLT